MPEAPPLERAKSPAGPISDSRPNGFLARRRAGSRRKRHADVSDACAVCGRTAVDEGGEQLGTSGWRVTGGLALCPKCQGAGWKLPEGAGLPYKYRVPRGPGLV